MCVCVAISWLKLSLRILQHHSGRDGSVHITAAQQSVQGPLAARLGRERIHHERWYRHTLNQRWSPSQYPSLLGFNSFFSFWFIFKAIMRSFSLLQEAIVPYIPTLIDQLTQKLLLVSKVIHTDAACPFANTDVSVPRSLVLIYLCFYARFSSLLITVCIFLVRFFYLFVYTKDHAGNTFY